MNEYCLDNVFFSFKIMIWSRFVWGSIAFKSNNKIAFWSDSLWFKKKRKRPQLIFCFTSTICEWKVSQYPGLGWFSYLYDVSPCKNYHVDLWKILYLPSATPLEDSEVPWAFDQTKLKIRKKRWAGWTVIIFFSLQLLGIKYHTNKILHYFMSEA